MTDIPIVNELRQLARHGQLASKEQWAALRQFMQESQPCFYNKISDRSAGLTYQELYVCMLVRLQFAPQEIAVLLGVSQQRITNLRASINRKLFQRQGSKGIGEALQKL